MTETTTPQQRTLDASGKTLGRVATQIASVLMGKDSTSYSRNKVAQVKLKVINASGIKISPTKLKETGKARYSGYPGGIYRTELSMKLEKKSVEEVLRNIVKGMLPSNKLRPLMLKNLVIEK